MAVNGCGNLKYLLSSSMVKSVVHLKKLVICDCKMIEEIIVCEGLGKENEVLLSELDFLKLKDLPNLARFCTCNLVECPFLKQLWIQNCPELRTFVCNPTNADVFVSSLFDEKVVLLYIPMIFTLQHLFLLFLVSKFARFGSLLMSLVSKSMSKY